MQVTYVRLFYRRYNIPDIFQQKMNDLFHEFEFIRMYIDEVLILKKKTGQIMYIIYN